MRVLQSIWPEVHSDPTTSKERECGTPDSLRNWDGGASLLLPRGVAKISDRATFSPREDLNSH